MLRWTTQLIPPEYMGSHIASGRSHTTGRRHDLGFRAATAIFGHLGIEWDLAEATADGDWPNWPPGSAFYKEQRELLLGGDVVRMDGYDDRDLRARRRRTGPVPGAVRDGRPGQPVSRPAGADSVPRPRPRPALPGAAGPVGAGARRAGPPAWWGARPAGRQMRSAAAGARNTSGVATPRVHPDQVVLYRADAVEGAQRASRRTPADGRPTTARRSSRRRRTMATTTPSATDRTDPPPRPTQARRHPAGPAVHPSRADRLPRLHGLADAARHLPELHQVQPAHPAGVQRPGQLHPDGPGPGVLELDAGDRLLRHRQHRAADRLRAGHRGDDAAADQAHLVAGHRADAVPGVQCGGRDGLPVDPRLPARHRQQRHRGDRPGPDRRSCPRTPGSSRRSR